MRRCAKASAQLEGGAKALEGLCGWTDPRENSSSESCVETSCETAMCGIVCVAASRSWVEMGSGRRRVSTYRDATLQERGKGELRGSFSERG